jgi:hypothetical protein
MKRQTGSPKSEVLRAARIEMRHGEDPRTGLHLRNRQTRGEFCIAGASSFVVRLPGSVSDPIFPTELLSVESSQTVLRYTLADPQHRVRILVSVAPCEDGLRFDAEVQAEEPIWLAEWRLKGLQITSAIIPALGGQVLEKRMPAGTTLTYKYPFWWNAQFLIGTTSSGGVWLRTKDADPRFKLARIKRHTDSYEISYGFEVDAPLTATTLKATWYLDCYKGTWKVPVDIHREWMASAFSLTRCEDHPHFPGWARDIDFILEIWGIGKESPEPLHTFRQMSVRLKSWAKMHDPKKTLLYLPGFAEHGIDSRAPAYNPSSELGGDDEFRTLMHLAHDLGFRVMIHTNVLAMTFDHPLFEKFRHHQVVDAFGRTQGWGLDIDGDWLAEPFFAYINPGVPEWGELMTNVIGDLVTRFEVDGVFLDQTLLAFNVSQGPNFVSGMGKHISRLQHAYPHILFAGEGLHEQVLRQLPMAQIHGIDSIAEVHGMEGRTRWRKAHPVSTYLFGPFTRFTAHLLTKHPSHPMFALQESAYDALNVIPALCLYSHRQPMDIPQVRKMIQRTKRLRRP